VLSCVGRGLCDGPITRPKEPCHVSNKIKKPKKGGQGHAWAAKATDDDIGQNNVFKINRIVFIYFSYKWKMFIYITINCVLQSMFDLQHKFSVFILVRVGCSVIWKVLLW
jgi:hypothetical protein